MVTRRGGSSLAPHPPPIWGRGCCSPGPWGGGAARGTDSVRTAAAAPGTVPAICLLLRPDGEGEGRPGGPRECPGSRPRRRVRRPGARSARGTLRSSTFLSRGGPGGPRTAAPARPHPSDSRPSREAARSQRHPRPHPRHHLKRRKWCPAPRRPPQSPRPRDSLQPPTLSSPAPGSLAQGPQIQNPRALPSGTQDPHPAPH